MVAYDSKEVAYVDPITGEMKMIVEPDYKPKTKTRTELIQVFIVTDTVLGWKVDRKEERSVLK